MAQWDRFDICEAHALLESDYNEGGWLRERPSNQRRMESTGVQLHRMKYSNPYGGGFDDMNENAQEIYLLKLIEWKLPLDQEQRDRLSTTFVHDWLRKVCPLALMAA